MPSAKVVVTNVGEVVGVPSVLRSKNLAEFAKAWSEVGYGIWSYSLIPAINCHYIFHLITKMRNIDGNCYFYFHTRHVLHVGDVLLVFQV